MRNFLRILFISFTFLFCHFSTVYSQEAKVGELATEVAEYMSSNFPNVKKMQHYYDENGYKCMVAFNLKDAYMELCMVKSTGSNYGKGYVAQSLSEGIAINKIPKNIKHQIKNGVIKDARKLTQYIRWDGNEPHACNIVWYVVTILSDCDLGTCEDEVTYDLNGDAIEKLIPI